MKNKMSAIMAVVLLAGPLAFNTASANVIASGGFENCTGLASNVPGADSSWTEHFNTGRANDVGCTTALMAPFAPASGKPTVTPFEGSYMGMLRGDQDVGLSQQFYWAGGFATISFAYYLVAYDGSEQGDNPPDWFRAYVGDTLLVNAGINAPVSQYAHSQNWILFTTQVNLSQGWHTLLFCIDTTSLSTAGTFICNGGNVGEANPTLWAHIDGVSVVPEPGTLALLGLGLAGLGFARRRKLH